MAVLQNVLIVIVIVVLLTNYSLISYIYSNDLGSAGFLAADCSCSSRGVLYVEPSQLMATLAHPSQDSPDARQATSIPWNTTQHMTVFTTTAASSSGPHSGRHRLRGDVDDDENPIANRSVDVFLRSAAHRRQKGASAISRLRESVAQVLPNIVRGTTRREIKEVPQQMSIPKESKKPIVVTEDTPRSRGHPLVTDMPNNRSAIRETNGCKREFDDMAELWARIDDVFVRASEGIEYAPSPEWVLHHSSEFGAAARHQMGLFLKDVPPYPPDMFHGAGIVTVAGGLKYFPAAYVTIRLIRRANCTLPIELWHTLSERFTPSLQELLIRKFHVFPRSVDEIAPSVFGGFGLKIAALLFSRFEQIIFVDADNHVIRDLTPLLSTPEFINTGLILWPDLWSYKPHDHQLFWDVVGKPQYGDEHVAAYETGQMVVDKRRKWMMLMLTLLWTLDHKVWFHITVPNGLGFGDKELFPLACRYLGLPFSTVRFPPAVAGAYGNPDERQSPVLYLLGSPPVEPEILDRQTIAFRYYRFEFLDIRVPSAGIIQIAEIILQKRKTENPSEYERLPLTGSDHCLSALSPTGRSPQGEEPPYATDNDIRTKWVQAHFPSPRWIVLFAKPFRLDRYAFISPNDSPERDPTSWELSGSEDGIHWIRLHTVCDYKASFQRYFQTPWFDLDGPMTPKCTLTGRREDRVVIGHTQVQHSPSGELLFLHQNCHKVSHWAASVAVRSWQGISWHVQTPSLLLSDRATILRNELRHGRSECRFRLKNADFVTDFVEAMPFDVEVVIAQYMQDLLHDPAFETYRRMRVLHHSDRMD